MTLATLIQKGGLQRIANGNPANAANGGQRRPASLAEFAALALANPDLSADAMLDAYEERAAVMEFEGGLSRDQAERLALARTLAQFGLHRLH